MSIWIVGKIAGKDLMKVNYQIKSIFTANYLYHDLYIQTDTLLLADVFEKFRDTCIEIYGLDPSHFLSLPGLAWQACLKKQM